jgi:hypothetical protein
LSLLEGNGHEFHIDARPRGSSAKDIDGQSFRLAVLDLGKWWEATIMSNPDKFVDHFKHRNTVDVGQWESGRIEARSGHRYRQEPVPRRGA